MAPRIYSLYIAGNVRLSYAGESTFIRCHRLAKQDVLLPTGIHTTGRLAVTGMGGAELAVAVFALNLTEHELRRRNAR